MKKKMTILIFFAGLLCLTGCASFGKTLKGWVGGKATTNKRLSVAKNTVGKIDRKKNYKRTDHQSLQEKSKLGADSGSLWIERGQGSYLFTQNTNRLIGDLVNVEIKGHAKKQIETKVSVIQNLIDRIKAQQEQRRLASEAKKQARTSKNGKVAGAAPPPAPAPKKQGNKKFDVKIVPSKITEITKDGSYVVKGDQPFMIGKREYKLMVRGVVRQEDFDDQGISAETLLDPKFDIVTNRKKGE